MADRRVTVGASAQRNVRGSCSPAQGVREGWNYTQVTIETASVGWVTRSAPVRHRRPHRYRRKDQRRWHRREQSSSCAAASSYGV